MLKRLHWILLFTCGTFTYIALYLAYHVSWHCLLNDIECVFEDLTKVNITLPLRKNSTCSERATSRGRNQKVISYCFYGSYKSPRKYFEGITKNAALIEKYYPGWVMRVYSNTTMLPAMVHIQENFSHVDFCLINNIEDHGNLEETYGMLWRFLPMSDPSVDVFMSRDLDSLIIPRELAAVNEWLNSNKTFHIMRDHPQHNFEMLGGMWGARLSVNRTLFQDLLVKMLNLGSGKHLYKGLDQLLLRKIVWPHTDDHRYDSFGSSGCILHDSYQCEDSKLRHETWRPWPSEREKFQFVGAAKPDQVVSAECPKSCRKQENWTYC